jgi:hypothetical protein
VLDQVDATVDEFNRLLGMTDEQILGIAESKYEKAKDKEGNTHKAFK